MTTPTPSPITDEQHAIARAYVVENIEDLLYWSDLAELLEEPFHRPERDHPDEWEMPRLVEIEGIPLRQTLRIDDDAWVALNAQNFSPGAGAAEILELLVAGRIRPVRLETLICDADDRRSNTGAQHTTTGTDQ